MGQHEKAKAALRRLVGNVEGYDIEHEYAVLQYENEKSKAMTQAMGTSDWRAFFRPVNIKRTVASALPFTFQNVCGVPLMFGYTTYFFSLAGVDDPFLATLIQQILLLVGICTSFYLVDKVGRRSLVLWGGALLAAICLVVGGLGFMEMTTSTGAAMVALCSLWAFVYANSLAPIGKLGSDSIVMDVSLIQAQAGSVLWRSQALNFVRRPVQSQSQSNMLPVYSL